MTAAPMRRTFRPGGSRAPVADLSPLPRSFFARDADVVARELMGQLLVHETPEGRAAVRVVETEAYFGPPGRNAHLLERRDLPAALRKRLVEEGDPASHSFPGPTARNRVMYGAPGHAYVYLIYGMHECMNVTTGPESPHEPQAVLLRAGEPVEGVGLMAARRALEQASPTRIGGPTAARGGMGAKPPFSRGGPTRSVGLPRIANGPAKLAKALAIDRSLYGADLTGGPLRFERGDPVSRVVATPRINVVGGEDLPLRFVDPSSPHLSRRPGR